MKVRLLISVMSLVLGLTACKDKKMVEAEKIVKEWIGKTIEFPKNFQCNVLGKDTILDVDLFQKDYKILLYVDSTGCSGCRLNLFQWEELIAEADSLFHRQLGFLLFFQPKNRKDMEFLFKQADFDYPVFIDMDNSINHLNHFPNNQSYQCFLLDKNNKVLMIGNPILSLKIWELYKQVISGERKVNTKPITTVYISSNEKTEITPDDIGFFQKTIRVYCNIKENILPLVVTGMVIVVIDSLDYTSGILISLSKFQKDMTIFAAAHLFPSGFK